MKAPEMRKAAALGGANGFQITLERNHSTATAAACNKWLTVWQYCHGYLSRPGCEAAFRAHPEWEAL